MRDFFEEKSKEVIRYRFSNPQKAYDFCKEIIQHGLREHNRYEVAYAHLYMGDTLFSLGRNEDAIRHMLKGEQLQKEHGYYELLMKSYNIMAIIYMSQDDDFLALDYFYRAMELAAYHGNYVLLGLLYNNIGVLLHNRGDAAGAAAYFEKGYEISKKNGAKGEDISYATAQFFVNMSGKYIEEKDYQKAKEYLDRAVDEPRMKESDIERVNILSAYALTLQGLGDVAAAYKACAEVLAMPQKLYQEKELFADFCDICTVLMELGYSQEAETVLAGLEKVYAQGDITSCKILLCDLQIKYYQTVENEMELVRCYKRYYELRQCIREEKNRSIAAAIDNRRRLEEIRLKNARLDEDNRELVLKSEIDELTGIHNRYGIRRRFNELYRKAKADRQKLFVAIFDIDYFKTYNDTYGHLQGDECLRRVAQIFKDTAGEAFFASRYGGDEFLAVGINKTKNTAEGFARELLDNIRLAQIPFLHSAAGEHVTISLGAVNVAAESVSGITELIYGADRVLYKVKASGKNNFMLSDV